MKFDTYYLVLLKKGPAWTPETTPAMENLQEEHLTHMSLMHAAGKLSMAGPVHDHSPEGDVRGVDIFYGSEFESLEEVRALVERDPAIQAGRLEASYLTWFVPEGAALQK